MVMRLKPAEKTMLTLRAGLQAKYIGTPVIKKPAG